MRKRSLSWYRLESLLEIYNIIEDYSAEYFYAQKQIYEKFQTTGLI